MSCAAVAKNFSGVLTVEKAAKSVLGPVYDKFHLVPDGIIRIADRSAAQRPHPPSYAKCKPAGRVLYERYEALAEQCAAAGWRRLLPRSPTAATWTWTERYNQKVAAAAEKGYRVSTLVATKMFSEKRA